MLVPTKMIGYQPIQIELEKPGSHQKYWKLLNWPPAIVWPRARRLNQSVALRTSFHLLQLICRYSFSIFTAIVLSVARNKSTQFVVFHSWYSTHSNWWNPSDEWLYSRSCGEDQNWQTKRKCYVKLIRLNANGRALVAEARELEAIPGRPSLTGIT